MRVAWVRNFLMMVFVAALFPFPAGAEGEGRPTASADVAVLSKYVWRGFELSDDSIVVQPSLLLGYKGFSLGLWGNLDTDVNYESEFAGDSKWNETDFTVSYDRFFGPVAVGVGYIYYALDGVDDSEEVFGRIGLNTFLAPTFTAYREVGNVPAWYLEFGISHSFPIYGQVTLDLAGTVSYYRSDDDSFVEVDDDLNFTGNRYRNLHNGLITAGLTVPLGDHLSITPLVAYSFPLSSRADDFIRYNSRELGLSGDSDFFYGGVSLSIAF
jgi:uncharacterized protein (TIGR02001 family)